MDGISRLTVSMQAAMLGAALGKTSLRLQATPGIRRPVIIMLYP